ncbi:MAG: secretin N-terminal domain-containing protein [Candidatus Omnitrophota bacterium]|nr:hypothetical protein [Candidatus Omnitrophota bacterium]MBU1929187.1 hypothetical protein [Candidatus Omnitrophota bacterium]MBU2035478.1 hypothetical protein [Candidatus Omnitrophota bacterium]MBU2221815.1 hypothetical protein [Candidatus Omnitrophota bacterium]MBU2258126.1 hypothetical protein [Candidatus Omnitrophota bacterium]
MKRFFILNAWVFIFLVNNLPAQEDAVKNLAQAAIPAAPAVSATAPEPRIIPLSLGIEGKVTLDLRNIDIVDALKYLSVKTGVNLITNKSVSGRITLNVENAIVKDVFDVMLRSNNLAFDKKGDIYNVMTQEEYKALYGKNFSDVRQVKVFKLKYAIPEQAFSFLDTLKSEVGRILVDPESGNVLIIDTPDRIEIIQQAMQGFEENNIVKIIRINYARAKDIEDTIKFQLDGKRVGLVKSDDRGNNIIIQTLPERMKQVEELVRGLDRQTKEVMIDTRVIQIKLSRGGSVGTQWEGIFDVARKYGMSYVGAYPFSAVQAATDAWRSRSTVWANSTGAGSYPFTGTASNYAAGKQSIGAQELHIGNVGKQDFDVIFKYILTLGDTKILSSPKLVVVNNQEAKIHVGTKDAYVTTTTTTGSTGPNTVAEQVNFIDTGVLLSVVPNINDEGFITLKVKAEVNSVIDTLITPTKNEIPILDTSLAETTVMVKDGSTIVIGGLRKEQETSSSQQTPFLGSIPFLGNLFKVRSHDKDTTELLILLTPKIISGDYLVTGVSGKGTDKESIKNIKEYKDLDFKEIEIQEKPDPASKVFIPAGKNALTVKGMKKR